MKSEHLFIAERAAAVHCPELLARPSRPQGDQLSGFGALGDRLAKLLAPHFAALLGGEEPRIAATGARRLDVPQLAEVVGQLAGNSLFAVGAQSVPLLAAIDATAVLRFMDRAFGGKGDAPKVLPEKFPLSVELMLGRLEEAMQAALAEALDLPNDGETLRAIDRNGSVIALAPFPPRAALVLVTLEVTEPGKHAYPIHFALAEAMLPALLGNAAAVVREPASPEDEPFASLPLELQAVLVDMRVSMATMATLEPGQVIPVAVARSVPIKLAGRTIATGQVGAADDCVAIRITQAFA